MIMGVDIQADIAAVQARIQQITQGPATPAGQPATGGGFAGALAAALNPNAAVQAVLGLSPSQTLSPAALAQSVAPQIPGTQSAFVWPAPGSVSSPFGPRKDPMGSGYDFHPGLDIASAEGAPIRAAAPGRVVQVGEDGGYGNVVVVDHGDGVTSRYAHCSQTFATVGETVAAGDEIAAVGSTGHSTGPHLHFEVRVGDKPVDPMPLFK